MADDCDCGAVASELCCLKLLPVVGADADVKFHIDVYFEYVLVVSSAIYL